MKVTMDMTTDKMINAVTINICSKNDGLDTTASLMKLMEEVGELSAAHLNKLNLANKSASSSPNVLEEAVDVLICAVDYLFKEGADVYTINNMIAQKTQKWITKIENVESQRDS